MTTMRKGKSGWKATDTFILGDAKDRHGEKDGRRVLSIDTDKGHRGGIESSAIVMFETGDGFSSHAFGMARDGSGDFRETLLTEPNTRCTEAAVKRLHARAMLDKDAVIQRARAYYERQDAIKVEEARKREERAEARTADRIDGYDRDDIGASPDY